MTLHSDDPEMTTPSSCNIECVFSYLPKKLLPSRVKALFHQTQLCFLLWLTYIFLALSLRPFQCLSIGQRCGPLAQSAGFLLDS